MANWTLTGELGSGKSVLAVSKILEFLMAGKPVASNMDIYLENLMPPFSKATYTRIPDFPTPQQLWSLGMASDSKNEETFGAVFLDELAVFLNSRDWQGKARDDVIKYLRHVRKQHWHTFFITQDIESIDAQARRALIEHKVRCMRTDRMTIPLLGFFLRLLGMSGKFVQMHIGIVHYGKSDRSPIVERWKYFGKSLHKAYNTDQIFIDEPFYDFTAPEYFIHKRPFNTAVLSYKGQSNQTAYQEGTYTVLSAWHLKGRYMSKLSSYTKPFHRTMAILFILACTYVFFTTRNQVSNIVSKTVIEYQPVQSYLITEGMVNFVTKEGRALTAYNPDYINNRYQFKVNNTWYATE